MASSGIDYLPNGASDKKSQGISIDEEKHFGLRRSDSVGSVRVVHDNTHRKLKSRHIQLIGIGGTIGTALYVQIGKGLMNGGPASLFIAFTLCKSQADMYPHYRWLLTRLLGCTVILAVTVSETPRS